MSFNNIITFKVIAQEKPNVIRNCRHCKRSTEYFCSDKFRVNANQKMIDIWLIYKCLHCESTWNYPILSRVHVNRIDPILHQKFMNNDQETIWYYAFQINKLRKLCDAVKKDIQYELIKEKSNLISSEMTVRICCKYDFGLRIDKLLAEILNISRSKVNTMAKEKMFLLNPNVPISDKVIDNLQVTVKGNWHEYVSPSLF
ncbi:DUF1062 domain-containing protein [Ureibacillus sp. 179-F W5.1 NHS]|uniref:DUF1062 domain-containing protein n=2 Tax=Bacillales TaxID=1385 RepID=A0A3M8HH63_9BACI|nr:DUF1062 domain-containing protein [Lysinibacillus halotolerans]RND01374.1 DUF1062 domain-containing protein [Lysinibacillus halotolerans]